MSALWSVFRLMLNDQRSAFLRGSALSFMVLAMGVALLGLSGWFITAAAAAGLAGAGAVFDVFRPSAMVRFLALGRAAARYGERLLTHDATLRALESLRMRVLAANLFAPHARMIRIRSAQALNRLTADIDALDGLPLRLALPAMAGLAIHLLALFVLWHLVQPIVAIWIFGGYLAGSVVIFFMLANASAPLSRRAEVATQAFRSRLVDLIHMRRDLAVYGRLTEQAGSILAAESRRVELRRQLDRAERLAGAALVVVATIVGAGVLGLGIALARSGAIKPEFAALGFFAALALAETLLPLKRAASDVGRMIDAARRVKHDLTTVSPVYAEGLSEGHDLRIHEVTLIRPGTSSAMVSGLSLALNQGETVAITGFSGSGKSTLLLAVAGLIPVAAGRITVDGLDVSDWNEEKLRKKLTLLPQRSQLMAGTVAEALLMSDATATEERLWEVLSAVKMDMVIRERGGLSAKIGPRGAGFSGGEMRRLALARALLRDPDILLLDEPTEGLDAKTAAAVLKGVRRTLPNSRILIAAHRQVEIEFADRVLKLV